MGWAGLVPSRVGEGVVGKHLQACCAEPSLQVQNHMATLSSFRPNGRGSWFAPKLERISQIDAYLLYIWGIQAVAGICVRWDAGTSVFLQDSEVQIWGKFWVLSYLVAVYSLKICSCLPRQLLAQTKTQHYICVLQWWVSKRGADKILHRKRKILMLLTPP